MENLSINEKKPKSFGIDNISAFKKKLDLIGRKKIKNVLLIQPIQVSEKKLDLKISLNKRYYMYPPYALGILNIHASNQKPALVYWLLRYNRRYLLKGLNVADFLFFCFLYE